MDLLTIFILGIIIGVILFIVGANIHEHFTALKNSNGLTLTSVRKKDLCTQPHQWMKVLLMQVGHNKDVNMCRICGFIAGSKLMASQEMIDRLESLEQKQKLEDEVFDEFLAQENKEIQAWFDAEIKSGVDLNKLADLHNAGQSFNARFKAYLEHRTRTGLRRNDS